MICTDLIVAEKVLFDQISQQVSIIGLWSEFVNFASMPAMPSFMIFTSFKDDTQESVSGRITKDAILKIKLNGKIIKEEKLAPSFEDPKTLSFSVSKLNRIKIEEVGQLEFELIIENAPDSIKRRMFMVSNNEPKS